MPRNKRRTSNGQQFRLLERILGRTEEADTLVGHEPNTDQAHDPRLIELQMRLDTMRGQVETILTSIKQPHPM